MTALTFPAALKKFITAQNSHDKLAQQCAVLAYEQYVGHKNLTPFNQLYTALNTNAKKNALANWVVDHSSKTVHFENSEFVVAKTCNDEIRRSLDLNAIGKVAFLTYKQPKRETEYTSENVVQALMRVIKRLEGDKAKPVDDAAKDMLARAKAAVASITQPVEAPAT